MNQSIVIDDFGYLVENFNHTINNMDPPSSYDDAFAVSCNGSSYAAPSKDYCSAWDEKDYFYVMIYLNEVSVEDMKVTDLMVFLEAECGVSSSDVRIEFNPDSAGFIIHFNVFVDTKATALAIADAVKELTKKEGCSSFLCRATDVYVYSHKEGLVSGTTFSHDSLSLLTVLFLIIAVVLF